MVLRNENKRNKIDSNFSPEEHQVIERKGGELVVRSNADGKVKRRHVTHAKRIEKGRAEAQEHTTEENTHEEAEPIEEESSSNNQPNQHTPAEEPAASNIQHEPAEKSVSRNIKPNQQTSAEKATDMRPKRKTRKPARFEM